MRTEIYSEEHQRLRKILKRERLAAGLRQSDIAEKTSRSQAYISKFEKGDLRLDLVDFALFCRSIGCNPHDVFDEIFGDKSGALASPNKREMSWSDHKLAGDGLRLQVAKLGKPSTPSSGDH